MTTTKEVTEETTTKVPIVPEVLTEEHHEAIRASWELPAYEKPVPAAPTSHKALYAGLIAGGVCLALGAGVGYWVGTQQATETVVREPYVVTKLLTPSVVDANGLTMGRRLAPIETQPPQQIPGYSVTHDSRIIEPVQTISFGRWTRPATF